jgi:catechol 2,3-dioxygenase-like lactoylglutathione lyase family enzyme
MFSHVMVGSNDIARSRKFYNALFRAMGGRRATQDEKGRLVYQHRKASFMVSRPIDGEPAWHANGATIGFSMINQFQVYDWYDAGMASGGTAIEDPPGIRHTRSGDLFLAYLRDPDGNKLCAVCEMQVA